MPDVTSNSGDREPVPQRAVAPIAASIAVAPAVFHDDGLVAAAKLEVAARAGGYVVASGWSVGPVTVEIRGEAPVAADMRRFARPDVTRHFDAPAGSLDGWACVLADARCDAVEVRVLHRGVEHVRELVPLVDAASLAVDQVALLGPVSGVTAFAYPPFSTEWSRALANADATPAPPRHAYGFLESALSIKSTGQVILVGWALASADTTLWLEDAAGQVHALNTLARLTRDDLHANFSGEFGPAALHGGFVARMVGVERAGLVRLKALTAEGVHLLSEIVPAEVPPTPVAVARWLSGISLVDGSMQATFDRVTGPVVEPLIAADRALWSSLPVLDRSLGTPVADPAVSIIVPLYGRSDFVEDQMVEWARDRWVRANAELLYVIDDPSLVATFRAQAEELHRLYGVPFRWIWGHANRGFSGANNLGAAHARAPRLLFLNSDAFAQRPGWLDRLVQVLDERADVGAVGPRLTFAEGGIQHAGMRFEWLAEHGVWLNRHPGLGLDPALDPATSPTAVPALTGACLLVRADDFHAVGGWDTGYLVGDFEDSDLCLKLQQRGLASIYVPDVQLTHLERQSMNRLGDGPFRVWVTLWNAVRHQRRWGELIARIEGGAA